MVLSKRTQIVAAVLIITGGLIGTLAVSAFLIAPIMTYPIAVDLPQRVINPPAQLQESQPLIDLRVDSSNQLFWNNSPVAVGELQQRMEDEVQKDPTKRPELRIDANPDSGYEVITKILAAAKNAEIKKIGFTQ